MENFKFILCLGIQKSGTTWLHSYLSSSKNFTSGFAKEYHIFDFKYSPVQRRKIRHSTSNFKTAFTSPLVYAQTALMRNFDTFYYQYFKGLLKDGKTVTGDITPSYSCLDVKVLKEIDMTFAAIGVEVVPVILFRDPFYRCKSSVQMNFAGNKSHVGFQQSISDFNMALLEYHTSEHSKLRADYVSTLLHAEQAFGERLGIFFYEELFTEANVKRLSHICGVEENLGFISKKVHAAEQNFDVDSETELVVREYFSDQYKYFHERFPQTKMLWK